MKAAVGVYDSHTKAVEAITKLKDSGYSISHISILGKAYTELVDNEEHITPKSPVKVAGVEAGTALGVALGVLTGVGLFAIPGFGFLYGAGAWVGAIAGFDFGLIGGGVVSVFTSFGVENDMALKYKKDLDDGKYLLIAQGTDEEINKAHKILSEHDAHSQLQLH